MLSSKSRLLVQLARRAAHFGVGPLLGLSLCAVSSACRYDTDKLFAEAEGTDAGVTVLPDDLIDLWKPSDAAEACAACAREKCAEENTACRDDAECVALTRCVAKSVDPATQNDCRSQHVPWLSEEIASRDTGGPYQQCVFLNKCAAECDARNQLACRGKFTWPQTSESTVDLRLRFVDGLSPMPPVGLRVRACQAEDSEKCLEVAGWQTADETGSATLTVPITLGSFQGYLEFEGGGLYPTLLRFGWPIARDVVTVVTVINDFSARAIINTSPVKVDPVRGLLQLRSFGCGGVSLRGVGFSVDGADAMTGTWYVAGQEITPNFKITETGDRGAGGIVNVLTGRSTVTAVRDGQEIASVTAPVRAGFMTIVVMPPGDFSQ